MSEDLRRSLGLAASSVLCGAGLVQLVSGIIAFDMTLLLMAGSFLFASLVVYVRIGS